MNKFPKLRVQERVDFQNGERDKESIFGMENEMRSRFTKFRVQQRVEIRNGE